MLHALMQLQYVVSVEKELFCNSLFLPKRGDYITPHSSLFSFLHKGPSLYGVIICAFY